MHWLGCRSGFLRGRGCYIRCAATLRRADRTQGCCTTSSCVRGEENAGGARHFPSTHGCGALVEWECRENLGGCVLSPRTVYATRRVDATFLVRQRRQARVCPSVTCPLPVGGRRGVLLAWRVLRFRV